MMIFTHKPGDRVHIRPRLGTSSETTLRAIFGREDIHIIVGPICDGKVKLGVDVPVGLTVESVADRREPAKPQEPSLMRWWRRLVRAFI